MERRIAAILAADMVAYSRLIEQDEAGTLARQKRHMIELIQPCIERFQGSVVKLTGDGLIAEFASVVGAVQCAVEIQKEMQVREEDQPEEARIRYRAAVNLGDVVFADGDVYGDGVNIAARLEGLAVPGGVVVSGTAYDLLKKNVDVDYRSLGEKRLKNISTPVRVYQVVEDGQAAPPDRPPKKWGRMAAVAAAAAVLAGALWFFADTFGGFRHRETSGRPSLAVLPLDNLGGDPSQDWFANGLSEDLTTDLSRHPGLFVIARNSAFETANLSPDPIDAARALNVAYVIEGSVRRVGDTLRLNIQLIDGDSGGHVWAERYDGSPEEVLKFMDSVSGEVLSALDLSGDVTEQATLVGETDNPRAFDAFLEGWDHYLRATPDDLTKSVPLLERAVELDPDYGRAHAALAAVYFLAYEKAWHMDFGYNFMERRLALEKSQEYLALAKQHPTGLAHQVMAHIHRLDGQGEHMLREAQAAVDLEPGDPNGRATLALARVFEGNPEAALTEIEYAMELQPHYPASFLFVKGVALFDQRRYEDALAAMTRAVERNPADHYPKYWIAAAQAYNGHVEAAADTRRSDPNYTSVDSLKLSFPYKKPEAWEHLADGLRMAGYP